MTKNRKRFVLLQIGLLGFLLAAICTTAAHAQEVKLLSLEEATELALNHSLQLKVDAAQMDILSSKISQNRQSAMPDVSLNTNYTRISDNITPFTVAFPTGDVVLNPQILNQSYNSLQLKQLIWSGGKVNYGIEISKKELQTAQLDLEKSKLNTVYNIAALWYNLYVLQTSKQTIDTNIKTLLQSQADIKNFIKQGIVLENEGLKIDLAITSLQSNLIDISNAVVSLNFNLCVLTGLPTTTVVQLPEIVSNTIDGEMKEIQIGALIDLALANRAELKSMQIYKEIAVLGLKISNSNYLPTLSAMASGNYNLPEQRVFPNKNEFTPTWFVGVNLNWNLSNFYKNPAKIKESRQTIVKTDILYNQIKEGIMIEVNTAYTEYLQANEKIVISKKIVEQATENFRVEQNKFSVATITPTEFLDANSKLLQAKLNLNAAYANAALALRKLDKTTSKTK